MISRFGTTGVQQGRLSHSYRDDDTPLVSRRPESYSSVGHTFFSYIVLYHWLLRDLVRDGTNAARGQDNKTVN